MTARPLPRLRRHVTTALVAVALLTASIATVAIPTTEPATAAAGFGDVPAASYFAEPVQWMADRGITQGTAPGCFSPDRAVTRGEVAVFLWRYRGEPLGPSEPFLDVGANDWFRDAVAWMVDREITTGTSATTFHPARRVTRGEAATFLWRLAEKPAGGPSRFADVATDRFYATAVNWMAGADITTGTSASTFSPDRPVTRGELATFLWRYDGRPPIDLDLGGVCGSAGEFDTLGVGAALPSGAECATRIRATSEIRPGNATPNATRGSGPHPDLPRVDGDFVGTTDEILQWAACKWGIDDDIVRAQAVKESWWHMSTGGDLTYDTSRCHWSVSWQSPCPESLGILQVRQPYHPAAMDDAAVSTAYNADYTYAVWRACYEGQYDWLNQVERGGTYQAGDLWGCLGVWFAGRWYTAAANGYIADVQGILADRTWTTSVFVNDPGPA